MITSLGLSDIDEVVVFLAEAYLYEHSAQCQPCRVAGKRSAATHVLPLRPGQTCGDAVCDACRAGQFAYEDDRAPWIRKINAFLKLAREGRAASKRGALKKSEEP